MIPLLCTANHISEHIEEECVYIHETSGEKLKEKEYNAPLGRPDVEDDSSRMASISDKAHLISNESNKNEGGRQSVMELENEIEFHNANGTLPTTEAEVDTWIRQWIRVEVKSLHAKYPWLKRNRSNIAWSFILTSVSIFFFTFYCHYKGLVSNTFAVLISTLMMATLHEVEHDIFHCQYQWRPNSWKFEIAMWLIYLFKFHVSPWWRMEFHLLHHQESGRKFDIEERLLGLGLPLGFLRLFVSLTPLSYFLVFGEILKDNPGFIWYRPLLESRFQLTALGVSLIHPISEALNKFFPHAVLTESPRMYLPEWLKTFSFSMLICCICASHVRHFCLTIVTTFTHYYGDVKRGVVHEQVQILDSPILFPLQMFCWFFGESHWIHHFYIQQPFWERALISWKVNKAAKSEIWKKIIPGALRSNDFPSLDMAHCPNSRHFKTGQKKGL